MGVESGSSYSTLCLLSVGKNNISVTHSWAILTGGGCVLVTYEQSYIFTPQGCCDLENQESVI